MIEKFEAKNKNILMPKQSKDFLEIEKATNKEQQQKITTNELEALK